MLYKRYDWRRPVFWSAIFLVFFLSSQNPLIVKHIDQVDKLDIEKKGENRETVFNNMALKFNGISFSIYSLIAKR